MKKTYRLALYFAVLAFAAAWIFLSIDPSSAITQESAAPQVGFRAPDFTLQSLDGQAYTLSEFKNSPIIVNLWATWCPPCRAEMPAIQKVYEEYKEQGLVALAVNMTYQDEAAAVAPFIAEYGLTFPILMDEKALVGTTYQIHSLPTTYFINRAGKIDEIVVGGPMAEALLRARIESILR